MPPALLLPQTYMLPVFTCIYFFLEDSKESYHTWLSLWMRILSWWWRETNISSYLGFVKGLSFYQFKIQNKLEITHMTILFTTFEIEI